MATMGSLYKVKKGPNFHKRNGSMLQLHDHVVSGVRCAGVSLNDRENTQKGTLKQRAILEVD